MSEQDRREHPRLPLELLVQFRLPSMDEFMREYASNISVGGMFIRTGTPHPEGSRVYLQFRLEDGSKIIEGLGQVVHVNPPEANNPGMGVEFINLDDASRAFIEELVNQRLGDVEGDTESQ